MGKGVNMTLFHNIHESNFLRIKYMMNTLKPRMALQNLISKPRVTKKMVAVRTKENQIAS